MKHTFLYTRVLSTLLTVAGNQVLAADADNVNVARYNDSSTATRAATADPAVLHRLFHTSPSGAGDSLDEFSGRDWNGMTPLGATVTHEMRAAKELVAPKTSAPAKPATFEDEARAGLY